MANMLQWIGKFFGYPTWVTNLGLVCLVLCSILVWAVLTQKAPKSEEADASPPLSPQVTTHGPGSPVIAGNVGNLTINPLPPAPTESAPIVPGNGAGIVVNGAPAEAIVLLLGNVTSWAVNFPHTVIEQRGEKMLFIEKERDGIYISANIFSQDGKIVGQLVRNRFIRNERNSWRTESAAHRIKVLNEEAIVVFDIEFVNPTTIRILGDYYLRREQKILLTNNVTQFGGTIFPRGATLGGNAVDLTTQR